jgi:5'(3')-deoxyribonucleotidase
MKRIFLDLDGTVAKFNVKNALQRFDNEIGFFAKLGAYKGIESINELAKSGIIYIISASPNEQADKDKQEWLDKYLPNVPQKNITMCRLGENKARVIESKYSITISQECYLLDDYTKNLLEWTANGGTGIKRLTSVADNSTGKWQGMCLKDLTKLAEMLG